MQHVARSSIERCDGTSLIARAYPSIYSIGRKMQEMRRRHLASGPPRELRHPLKMGGVRQRNATIAVVGEEITQLCSKPGTDRRLPRRWMVAMVWCLDSNKNSQGRGACNCHCMSTILRRSFKCCPTDLDPWILCCAILEASRLSPLGPDVPGQSHPTRG